MLLAGQKINFQYKGSSPYASNILSGNAVATGNFQVIDGTAVGTYSNITMYKDATTGIYYIILSPEQSSDGNGHAFVSVNYPVDAIFTVVNVMSSGGNSNSGGNGNSTSSGNSSSNIISSISNYLYTYRKYLIVLIAIIIIFLIFYRK